MGDGVPLLGVDEVGEEERVPEEFIPALELLGKTDLVHIFRNDSMSCKNFSLTDPEATLAPSSLMKKMGVLLPTRSQLPSSL